MATSKIEEGVFVAADEEEAEEEREPDAPQHAAHGGAPQGSLLGRVGQHLDAHLEQQVDVEKHRDAQPLVDERLCHEGSEGTHPVADVIAHLCELPDFAIFEQSLVGSSGGEEGDECHAEKDRKDEDEQSGDELRALVVSDATHLACLCLLWCGLCVLFLIFCHDVGVVTFCGLFLPNVYFVVISAGSLSVVISARSLARRGV